uniref:Uncharacterized protein n=1 Tax=Arundo donax TaxID=35708 RepID=A0A0A9B742_ARUDO
MGWREYVVILSVRKALSNTVLAVVFFPYLLDNYYMLDGIRCRNCLLFSTYM